MIPLLLLSVLSNPDVYRWGPPADYVTSIQAAPPGTRSHAPRYGAHYLLVDLQHRSVGSVESLYVREHVELLTAEGVDSYAQRQFSVDPSYERLVLHSISVLRDGARSNRRKQVRVDAFRRERALESGMYDGIYTVDLTLSDIRVGDVVEIAYTISGRDPAMRGHRRVNFILERNYPIERFHLSSTWDKRLAQWRTVNSDLKPRVEERTGRTTIEYEAEAMAPQPEPDPMVPHWVLSSAVFQATTHGDWNSVVNWGLPLYRVKRVPAVSRVAKRLMKEHVRPKDRLIAALRFVQDDFRYLSVGLGAGGYVPRPPMETLKSRYGDCKDKTLLLVTLLDEMGIVAHPALVSTTDGWFLEEQLPSARLFDHVVASATLDGTRYWFDPTVQHQRGDLEHTSGLPYGFALLLKPGVESLLELTPGIGAPTTRITETVDLRDYKTGAARVRVKSEMSGSDADRVRGSLQRDGIDGLKKRYLMWYRSRWTDVRYEEDPEVRDDPVNNRLTVVESLHVPTAVIQQDGATLLYSHGIASVIPVLEQSALVKRSTPISVSYPVHHRHTLNVIFPDGVPWTSAPEVVELDNPAFYFHYSTKTSHRGERLVVEYELRSQHPVVLSKDAPTLREPHDTMVGYRDFNIVLPQLATRPRSLLDLLRDR